MFYIVIIQFFEVKTNILLFSGIFSISFIQTRDISNIHFFLNDFFSENTSESACIDRGRIKGISKPKV